MDVLGFLLKNEDNYKNGIYWCLRDSDEIGSELHKLLWKERVYFVNISGFDELFASLSENLLPNTLPLDMSLLSDKSHKLLSKIESQVQSNKYKSLKICDDVKAMRRTLHENNLRNLTRPVGSKDDDKKEAYQKEFSELEFDEQIHLMTLNNCLSRHDFNEFKNKLDILNDVNKIKSMYFRTELLLLQAKYFKLLGNKSKAIDCYKDLLKYSENKSRYYCKMAELLPREEAVPIIDSAIKEDHNYYKPYLIKARILERQYRDNVCNKPDASEVDKLYWKSIEKYPSLENSAWIEYGEYLFENKSSKKCPEKLEQVIDVAKLQDDSDIYYMQLECLRIKANSGENWKESVNTYLLNKTNELKGYKKYLSKRYILSWFVNNSIVDDFESELAAYKSEYIVDETVILSEAKYYKKCKGNVSKALEILLKWSENDFSLKVQGYIFDCLIAEERLDDATRLAAKYFPSDDAYTIDILEAKEDWDGVIEKLKSNPIINSENYTTSLSFAYMKAKKYEVARDLLKRELDASCWKSGILIINFELCQQIIEGSVKTQRLDKLIEIHESDTIKFGALVLLDRIDDARKELKKMFVNDFDFKETSKKWVLFDLPKAQILKKLYETAV
jgi:hypothetical protein